MAQVEEHEPPPNPTKEADPRSAVYRREYGETCWELDALEPRLLVDLVQAAIRRHMHVRKFNAREQYADAERKRLVAMSHHWEAMTRVLAEEDEELEDEPDEEEDD
jgi:hypothetical protein